jgi:hypothetical protein
MTTKEQLTKGTLVRINDIQMGGVPYGTTEGESPRWTLPAGVYEVTDLFNRKSYTVEDSVAVKFGPTGGVAAGIKLADIVEIVEDPFADRTPEQRKTHAAALIRYGRMD